jgi:hypothetical protein
MGFLIELAVSLRYAVFCWRRWPVIAVGLCTGDQYLTHCIFDTSRHLRQSTRLFSGYNGVPVDPQLYNCLQVMRVQSGMRRHGRVTPNLGFFQQSFIRSGS